MAAGHLTTAWAHPARSTRLFLDSARLGRMSPSAKLASEDLAKLVAEEGCSVAFRSLFHRGFDAWPKELRNDYPGLFTWQGVSAFKRSFRTLLGLSESAKIALAARSADLVRLAGRVMARKCRRILVPDLAWPAYRRIIEDEVHASGCRLVPVSVRRFIEHFSPSEDHLASYLADEFINRKCDALMLPAISHDGIRLPLRMIHRAITRRSNPAFVFVDGAQQLAHAPLDDLSEFCDFYVAGSHKWLGGHMPLGIAAFPKPETRRDIESALRRRITDPILSFTERLERGDLDGYSETVNLFPLFTAGAALHDVLADGESAVSDRFQMRLSNARLLAPALPAPHIEVLQPPDEFKSGILLALLKGIPHDLPAEALAARFQARGIALTAYDGGLLRLAMPHVPLHAEQILELRPALLNVSDEFPGRPLVTALQFLDDRDYQSQERSLAFAQIDQRLS